MISIFLFIITLSHSLNLNILYYLKEYYFHLKNFHYKFSCYFDYFNLYLNIILRFKFTFVI